MICSNPDCGPNSIITVFGANGLQSRCAKCGAVPTPPAKPVPVEAPRPVQVAEAVAKRPGKRIAVIALARAEARELKREIRVLEAKKRQLAELQRLISAAAKKPSEGASNNVRQLRKQGL